MRKIEGKISLIKNSSQNNISHSSSNFYPYSSQIGFLDDEFIIYINELSASIKQLYKINSQNFNQLRNIINKSESIRQRDNLIKIENNTNKSLLNSFQLIESSFSEFYANAKEIFRKMKNYQGLKIESYSRKNDKTKILSYDRTSQTSYPINKIQVTNNNINISNNIINNDSYKNNNIGENIKYRFKKRKGDNEESNHLSQNVVESYNNLHQSNSNKYMKTYDNQNLNTNSNLDYNTISVFNSSSSFRFSENENERYKKILNSFSNDVYHFLGSIQQLHKNYSNVKVPENLKLTFEKEKNILTQICLNYISNTNPNTNTISKNIYKNNNYITPSLNSDIKIESEYDKLRNDYDLVNKELFITQRENNELRGELDNLKKNLNLDNIIRVNTEMKKKDNELRRSSYEPNREINLLRNNSNSSINSGNTLIAEGDYKMNYKIIKNENEKMKGIITNLSREIADMKKKNYELSPLIEHKYNRELSENKIDNNNQYQTISPIKNNISYNQSLQVDKTQFYENQINNLTKKINEMAIQLKEVNIQRNNCLNIIKQDEVKIKEQEITIQKYMRDIKKSNSSNSDKKINVYENSIELEEKIEKLEKEKSELNLENDNLNNQLNELKMKLKNMEKNNNENKIERDYKINDINGLKLKIKKLEKTNSDLKIENKSLNDDIYELKNKIKKNNVFDNNNIFLLLILQQINHNKIFSTLHFIPKIFLLFYVLLLVNFYYIFKNKYIFFL